MKTNTKISGALKVATGRDNSSFDVGKPPTQTKMGGSVTNLAHSLSGVSANQRGVPGSK